jgi:hypothetical protein
VSYFCFIQSFVKLSGGFAAFIQPLCVYISIAKRSDSSDGDI